MNMTRERKIIAGVLTLALAGFGYDRMTAVASDTGGADSASLLVGTGSSNVAAIRFADEEASLAQRLSEMANKLNTTETTTFRDVFRPANVSPAMLAAPSADRTSPDRFVQLHRLSTVSPNGQGGGVAIVDGKMMQIGQTLDGYKLTSLTRTSATFDSGAGVHATLTVGR